MYSTTLRLDDDLARFLQEEAQTQSLSVNALLAELVREARKARARHRLAKDWAAYAQDAAAQDVSYAHHAQAEVAAEPKAKAYRAKKRP
ncbi:MAG TPA: hypothetical protein VFF76_01275 [Holophagaceae bacterium]|jgi:hypothetical protein|nr:hypothetical protein [Holophagaceae bacterium]